MYEYVIKHGISQEQVSRMVWEKKQTLPRMLVQNRIKLRNERIPIRLIAK